MPIKSTGLEVVRRIDEAMRRTDGHGAGARRGDALVHARGGGTNTANTAVESSQSALKFDTLCGAEATQRERLMAELGKTARTPPSIRYIF